MGMKNFFVGAKAVILNDADEILLLHSKKGYWELPGGRIDDDETIEQALIRELHEELINIVSIEIREIVHAVRMPFDLKDNLGLVLVFYKVVADFKGDVEVGDEHDDYDWTSLAEATKTVDEYVMGAIAKLSL